MRAELRALHEGRQASGGGRRDHHPRSRQDPAGDDRRQHEKGPHRDRNYKISIRSVTMKKGDIERINELARKAKTVGLTPEENEERAKLRRAYIDSVVGDLRQQLDNTYIVDAKGNKRKLRQ